MLYLFECDVKGSFQEQDPSIAVIPEFKAVYKEHGNDGLKWIALMWDYKSPYKRLSESERRRRLNKEIFKKDKAPEPETAVMKIGSETYKALQYDPLIEMDNVFRDKIEEIKGVIVKTRVGLDNAKQIQDMMLGMGKLMEQAIETRKQVEDLLSPNRKNSKLRGGGINTLIESRIKQLAG